MLNTIDIRDGVTIQDSSDNLMSVGFHEYTLLLEHSDALYSELRLHDRSAFKERGIDFILFYRIDLMSYRVKITLSAHYGDFETDLDFNREGEELLKNKILAWVSERLAV